MVSGDAASTIQGFSRCHDTVPLGLDHTKQKKCSYVQQKSKLGSYPQWSFQHSNMEYKPFSPFVFACVCIERVHTSEIQLQMQAPTKTQETAKFLFPCMRRRLRLRLRWRYWKRVMFSSPSALALAPSLVWTIEPPKTKKLFKSLNFFYGKAFCILDRYYIG